MYATDHKETSAPPAYSEGLRGCRENEGMMYDLHPHKICFTDLGPKQLVPMLSRNVSQLFGAGAVGRASRNAFSVQTV